MPNILFVGGQSIGHVAPCVAVWRAIENMDPTTTAHFICSTKRMDAEFLEKEHLPFTQFPRITPISFAPAYLRARHMLRTHKVSAVLSSGGSLGVPVCMAANRLGIPVVLYEANAVSGRANSFIARFATKVCLGFPQVANSGERLAMSTTRYSLPASRSVYTGHPIRPEITRGTRERGLELADLQGEKPVLLTLGGSQGAQALNEAVRRVLPELLALVDIIHITGKGKSLNVIQPGYRAFEFAHETLPHFYACASLALSRAGAGSISELQACGIPSILVPLPGLAQDHQTKNAAAAEKTGGFMVIPQENLHSDLAESIGKLAEHADHRTSLRQALLETAQSDATNAIARAVCSTIK